MAHDDSHIPGFKDAARREGCGINAPLDENGRTALHISAEKGDMDSAAKLLGVNANPNLLDKLGQTPLYAAIKARNLPMVNLLLERGATFRIEDNNKCTPLMWAIEQGCDVAFLEQLRQLGIMLKIQNSLGRSALHAAAAENRPEIIEYLVQSGVPADLPDWMGNTALHLAAEKKVHEAMRCLIFCGADPLLRTSDIRTPLHISASGGDETAVDILLTIPAVKQSMNDFKTYAEGFTPLMAAVSANHLNVAQKLIDVGADLSQRDNQNRSSLFIAVASGHPEMAKLLIGHGADVQKTESSSSIGGPMLHHIGSKSYRELLLILYTAGADLNAVDSEGLTALYHAASALDGNRIKSLLDLGADPNIADKFGRRPLDLVVEQSYYTDNPGLVGLLLNHGAQPNLPPFVGTRSAPLHNAARYGHEAIVRLLLLHNAAIDEQDRSSQGSTPFLIAVEYGHQKVAWILLEKGADPLKKDKELKNALHAAAHHETAEFLGALLEIKELAQQIDAQDSGGMTPLHHACWLGKAQCAKMLIERGADPWLYDAAGLTPVHRAALSNNISLIFALEKALGSAIDWNVPSRDKGETPLHIAAKEGSLGAVEQLLALGADVFIKGKHGLSPLHLAIANDHDAVANVLVEHIRTKGVSLDQQCDNNGWTALHYAATRMMPGITSFLLSAGADIDVRAPDGRTPLHIAVQAGQRAVVEYLISKGADISAVNTAGKTPLDMALAKKHEPIVAVLMEALQAQKMKQFLKPAGKNPPPPAP